MKKFLLIAMSLGMFLFGGLVLAGCSGEGEIPDTQTRGPLMLYVRQDTSNLLTVELHNKSDKDIEITYYLLIREHFPTAKYELSREIPKYSQQRVVSAREHVAIGWSVAGLFGGGRHRVRFSAVFYLNHGQNDQQLHNIVSNTIEIRTVVGNIVASELNLYLTDKN